MLVVSPVSYFESVQNDMNYYWTHEEVISKLDTKMTLAFHGVLDMHYQRKYICAMLPIWWRSTVWSKPWNCAAGYKATLLERLSPSVKDPRLSGVFSFKKQLPVFGVFLQIHPQILAPIRLTMIPVQHLP